MLLSNLTFSWKKRKYTQLHIKIFKKFIGNIFQRWYRGSHSIALIHSTLSDSKIHCLESFVWLLLVKKSKEISCHQLCRNVICLFAVVTYKCVLYAIKKKVGFYRRETGCLFALSGHCLLGRERSFLVKETLGLPRDWADMLTWEGSSWLAGHREVDIHRHALTHMLVMCSSPGGTREKHLTLIVSWAPGMMERKVGTQRWLKPSDPSSSLWALVELKGSLKERIGTAEAKQAGRSAHSPFLFEFSGFLEELCPVCVLESSFLSVQPVSFWVHWLQGRGADRWTQMMTDEPTQGSRHAFNIESKINQTWFSLGSLSTWLCSLKGGFLTWHSNPRSLCPLHCCRAAVLAGSRWQLPSGAAGGRGHECKRRWWHVLDPLLP